MRFALPFSAAVFVLAALACGPICRAGPPSEPLRLIFDTDLGNDVDDALALAMIHALQSRGECRLLAVTVTKDNPYAAAYIDLLNTFYGRADIPIGTVRQGATKDDGKYIRQIAAATQDGRPVYPHKLQSGADAPEAVGLLRRVLAAQPDGSVAVVQVGFSTNLARLLASGPDDASPLAGPELVRQKVRLLSVMAGGFSPDLAGRYREYNVVTDVASAQRVFHEWPTPTVASGFEVGRTILHPGQSMREDYRYAAHHPVRDAYERYRGLANDQPTWDLTAVLYAVRPEQGYFDRSPSGRIVVADDGSTRFEPDPAGKDRYLVVNHDQTVRVREAQAMLCSQPPEK